mmetsp:Transcript_20768/g.43666  ORF Transcript_20768/g.43666 Transcript_20768/m.43666 type:complete len:459 (+) Transcript_20768:55-1431(+)
MRKITSNIAAFFAMLIGYNSFNLYLNSTQSRPATKLMSVERNKGKDRTPHKVLAGKSRSKPESCYSSDTEPYFNRWKLRFSPPHSNCTSTGKYLFFKHIRKAGGTTLRSYFNDVFSYHGRTRNKEDFDQSITKSRPDESDDVIYYVEQEFSTMDYKCPIIDPRWNNSLRIITLRHPIERHISEFFFSGPGQHFPIHRDQLYVNQTYTKELSEYLNQNVPLWMERDGGGKGMEGKFEMLFGRFYVDNFQLRALAGCSSRECLEEKNISDEQMLDEIRSRHPSEQSYAKPVPKCTYFFTSQKQTGTFQLCSKRQKKQCSNGCDGPCFYPSVAWGEMTANDVDRAVKALEAYDVVLLMETFDEEDQSAWLSDVMGVPRDADFALSKRDAKNSVVEKSNKREKTHFYRDLFEILAPEVLSRVEDENKLEIMFFDRAVEINNIKTCQWERDVKHSSRESHKLA